MGVVRLNRKLVLEEARRLPDGAGGYAESWAERGTLWAEVTARTGRETAGGAVSRSSTGLRIVVRAAPQGAPSRPVAGQRFRDGTRIFKIESVAERGSDAKFLTCFAEEEVAI